MFSGTKADVPADHVSTAGLRGADRDYGSGGSAEEVSFWAAKVGACTVAGWEGIFAPLQSWVFCWRLRW